jgi:hypothetical protein
MTISYIPITLSAGVAPLGMANNASYVVEYRHCAGAQDVLQFWGGFDVEIFEIAV